MTHTDLLRDLIVLYGMATAIAYLMRRAQQSTVVGYLLTGMVAGPSGLRLISDSAAVEVLAEVGVALLLFTIGLELSLGKLRRMKQLVLGAGSLQVAATVLVSFGVLVWQGLAARESLFWGFLVATSSTAIVMKLLHSRTGTTVLAVVRALPVTPAALVALAASHQAEVRTFAPSSPSSSLQPSTSRTAVFHNPDAAFRFAGGDQLVLVGPPEQLTAGLRLLQEPQVGTGVADRREDF